jgi:hypothetical protein
LSKWFKARTFILKFDKTNFMKFCFNNNTCINLNAAHDNKTMEEVHTKKFLGLQINNNLNWETNIEYIIPKLSSVCIAIKTVTSFTKKNRNFKSSILCLLHHVIWNKFLEQFNRVTKIILCPKQNH